MMHNVMKNKVVRNIEWLIVGRIIHMIISFFVGVLSARYLGPGKYGLINYGTAYVSFFSSICSLGINSVVVNEFVKNREKEGVIIGTAIGLKAIASIMSYIAIVMLSAVVDRNDKTAIIVVVICGIGLIFNVADIYKYWFQSYLNAKITALVALVGYGVISVYKIILMATDRNVMLFALSTPLEYLIVGMVLAYIYKKKEGRRLQFSVNYAKELLKISYHFILPSLMVSIYAQTDKIMLKQLLGESEVGIYSTAVALSNVWCFLLNAIIDSLNPLIMCDFKEGNKEAYLQKNRLLYAIVFYVSIGMSLLYCIMPKSIIGLLYGEAYESAYTPLCVITWYSAFSYLGVARNAWVVCENKQKYLIWLYVSAAVSNVGLNIVLIPIMGVTGAALASLCAQVVSAVIAPCFIKEMKSNVLLICEGIMFRGIFTRN